MLGHSIATKLMIAVLAVAVIPLCLSAYVGLRSFEQSMKTEIGLTLSAHADSKLSHMRRYLDEREGDALGLALSPSIATALTRYDEAFTAGGPTSAGYRATDAELEPMLRRQQETGEYSDLFLISRAGDIVFTVARESDFGTNLVTGPWRHTELAEIFRRAVYLFAPTTSEFREYTPSSERSAFVGAPVSRNGRLIGVLALQMNTRRFYELTSDATGLGETGETVLVVTDGSGATLLSPHQSERQAPFSGHVEPDPRDTVAALAALKGEKGIATVIDHRHRRVLATWRYLPRLQWGFVVKIDADEAFAPVERWTHLALIIAAIAIVLVTIAAHVVSRRISQPIRSLTHTALAVAGGDLEARARVDSRDEVWVLASAFNDMLAKLSDAREATARQHWMKTSETELLSALRGDKQLEVLARDTVCTLARLVGAQVGALFVVDDDEVVRFAGGYAFRPEEGRPLTFEWGEGLVGQAAQNPACQIVSGVPEEHFAIDLGAGEARPCHLLMVPFSYDARIVGVIEMGSLNGFSPDHLLLAESVTESIAIAIRSAQCRCRMAEFFGDELSAAS